MLSILCRATLISAFCIYFLVIPTGLASGTYVPPVTSYGASDNVYNVGKGYIFKAPKAPKTTKNPFRVVAKKSKSPECSSCHSNGFKRGSLLEKKNQLSQIILNCNGPHKIYCHGGTSSLKNRISTIVHTLKVRYKLEK